MAQTPNSFNQKSSLILGKICYVNGIYAEYSYENVTIGKIMGWRHHHEIEAELIFIDQNFFEDRWVLKKLEKSLKKIKIAMPITRQELEAVLVGLIKKNSNLKSGSIYIKVSRGSISENAKFPKQEEANIIITIYGMTSYFGVDKILLYVSRWLKRLFNGQRLY